MLHRALTEAAGPFLGIRCNLHIWRSLAASDGDPKSDRLCGAILSKSMANRKEVCISIIRCLDGVREFSYCDVERLGPGPGQNTFKLF